MANQEFSIKNRKIGPKHPPLVIAEIGINHNGSMTKAKQMIDDAHASGVECVKFQSHILEDEMVQEAKKVKPGNTNKSIWDVMEKATLSRQETITIKKYVEDKDMLYLCTPFSRAAAKRLNDIGVNAFKIGSGECNNYPLIEYISGFGKPVILSTGMNNLSTIKPAVKILKKSSTPFALLHCVSIYPTPYEKVNLGALEELQSTFTSVPIGLSDHSLGNYTAFAAVALGASIIEKHFTSDKRWSGPDIPISLNSAELRDLILGTRAIHKSLGGEKKILPEEKPTIDFAYACVVTIKEIQRGEKFTKDNIWAKRPGTGEIKAADFNKVLGRKSLNKLPADTQISWKDVQ